MAVGEAITIDDDGVYTWCRFRGPAHADEVNALIQHYERCIARGTPYGVVIAAPSWTEGSGAAHLKRIGEWMKKRQAAYQPILRGIAFVNENPIMRFALSTLFTLQPLRVPYTVVATEIEADRWIRKQVGASGASSSWSGWVR